MAYNDSSDLPVSQNTYSLGGYTFELKVQTVHEPGEPNVVSVFAICRGPDGSRETQALDFPASTIVESWSVECNETEATVYAVVSSSGSSIAYTQLNGTKVAMYSAYNDYILYTSDGYVVGVISVGSDPVAVIFSESSQISYLAHNPQDESMTPGTLDLRYPITLDDGRTVYTSIAAGYVTRYTPVPPIAETNDLTLIANILFSQGINGEKLIGRFAIDIREADGGPEGDWDEPGDTGDPEKTLYVGVAGATAGQPGGRIPLEPEIAKIYGSGGTGGNGGGGGAGASTVIIYDFATDKAGSVVQTASSKGSSGRSSGGNGGRGADGCILIFY